MNYLKIFLMMMKHMKKTLLSILSVGLLLSLFSSCGTKSDPVVVWYPVNLMIFVQNQYGEDLLDSHDWLEETYNFTLKQTAISDWGSTPQDFVDYVTTGGDDNNYVFVLRNDPAIVSGMANGLMYDLSTLDCLDFSSQKFQANKTHEMYSKGDAIYCMFAGPSEARTGVFFNKRLLEKMAHFSIHMVS